MRILILLLVAAGVAVELVAPSFVEARIERRVQANFDGAVAVEADIDSFPMVTRALLTGEVGELTVRLDEVSGQALPFNRVALTLRGVQLERSALVRGEAQIEGLDEGEAVAEVDLEALAAAAGVPVDPAALEGARVRQGHLELTVGGAPVRIGVPVGALPCEPDGAVEGGRLVLRCTFTEVPPILVRAVAEASA